MRNPLVRGFVRAICELKAPPSSLEMRVGVTIVVIRELDVVVGGYSLMTNMILPKKVL